MAEQYKNLDVIWSMIKTESGKKFLTQVQPTITKWVVRGDGVAVYENVEIGNPEAGHHQYLSFGSKAAQLESVMPPEQLPDIGGAINWRYRLIGYFKN